MRQKDDMVENVIATLPVNVSFRWDVVNENRVAWFDLVSKVVHVRLSKGNDVFLLNLSNNSLFTVWSML